MDTVECLTVGTTESGDIAIAWAGDGRAHILRVTPSDARFLVRELAEQTGVELSEAVPVDEYDLDASDEEVRQAVNDDHRLGGAEPAEQQGPTDENGDSTFDEHENAALKALHWGLGRMERQGLTRGGDW